MAAAYTSEHPRVSRRISQTAVVGGGHASGVRGLFQELPLAGADLSRHEVD